MHIIINIKQPYWLFGRYTHTHTHTRTQTNTPTKPYTDTYTYCSTLTNQGL